MSTLTDNRSLATEPIGKLIITFATPCVIAMLVNSLYNVVDQIFIGRGVGFLGNGATNVVFPITVIALALALLVGDGAAAYYSLRMGENRPEHAYKGVGNALILLALLGVAFTILCSLFLPQLLTFFGSTDRIQPYALEYGGIILLGIPLVLAGTGANSMIRASGNPSFAMKSMIVGAVINTVLDYLFVFPLGMGVKGAAIATIIGQAATFALSVSYLLRRGSPARRRENFRLEKAVILPILGCGVSSCINQIAITVVVIFVNKALTLYGAQSPYGPEIPLTAVGIVMKVNQIIVAILIGIAVGSQPIIGYNYGAGHLDRVKKTFAITATLSSIVSLCAGIAFVAFPGVIVAVFGSGEPLYNEFARKAFRIFLMLCFVNGFQIACGVFFQAMGKPLQAAIISLSRQIIIMIPAVILLPKTFGVEGILYAGPLADGLAFIAAVILIVRELRILGKETRQPSRTVRALPENNASESVRIA